MKYFSLFAWLLVGSAFMTEISAQTPAAGDSRLYDIVDAVSTQRIESDIRKLAGFGTRNTLSDTLSETRGIGAARRWIKSEFERISKQCNDCLEVSFQSVLVKAGESPRIPVDTEIVNVIAIQRGTLYPDHYVIMSGDIDSRASDVINATIDAPGANDNASGMAGTMEAARVLSQYSFPVSIVYAGLSGEEQGLFGGKFLAQMAKDEGRKILAVLNNDMIGNIEGIDGVIDNRTFRIFSEPTPVTETEQERKARRYAGGEVDGISRQLARYVHRLTSHYMPELNPMLIYRLDRFGRGGHHRPFNDMGFAAIRIMEAHENYNRQHQDIRLENGIHYGDVIEGVNFDYAARLTAVNAISLASMAWAPQQPTQVKIGGAVLPSTTLAWQGSDDTDLVGNLAGYKIYWRDTTVAQWQHSRFVGKVNQFTLKNIVIDNYLFGVAAVSKSGHESVVVFPSGRIR
ncbi:MAG: M28 family metallopeptidase [Proteobacteria bacterium]|nr:M28 family metallopeptidase [Pseudomonadota bacterium]